jgi:DNA-binding CsgD family transcriptional regulator
MAGSIQLNRKFQSVYHEPLIVMPLTEIEKQVLMLASLGHTVPSTAKCLNRARATIKSHRATIQDKLGTDNITHSVAVGIRQKIIR